MTKEFQDQGHEVMLYTFCLQYPNFLFPGKTQYSEDPAPSDINIQRTINSVNPLNWISQGNKIKKEDYDLLIVKFWLPFMGPAFGTLLRRIKSNKKTKVITIIDNIIPHESRIGDRPFTQYFVRAVDGFIAMTQSVLDEISLFDTKKPRLLSPHPIFDNFGAVEPRAVALNRLGLPKDKKYFMFFGFVRDYKGLDLLLEAFADSRFRENGYKLIIAGEYYSNKEKYQTLIKKLDLEKDIYQFDKFIADSEVAHYFNACDLLVQPYKTATQSGVTQIAYHFNKPMIVTNVGGLSEMCPDGKVGYVVDPNPKAIADSIIRFYNNTDHIEMQKSLLEEKKKYSWEILINNVLKLKSKINS
ncbi:MAG: D-inositol-3-phosphate glycosyltransferase [Saprospiraceae bacterium]|jgi:D-inositol-3-phosphate glycosyltransferase|tara:strand:- start:84 stop:1154 length:1071 start_codon:yes stop_codon:yes gene_type:complete